MEVEAQRPEGGPREECVAGYPAALPGVQGGIRQECAEVLQDPRRILWQPSPERMGESNMVNFSIFLSGQYGSEAPSLERLYEWSIENPRSFWRSFFEFSGIIYEGDCTRVLTYVDPPTPHPDPLPVGEGKQRMIDARWFPDVRLNFAENLLRTAEEQPEKEAIAFFGEDRLERHLTFGELKEDALRFSRLLDASGVGRGDRIAAFMPNIPETVSAMLATTARGAIWSSASPEFGVDAVVDRLGQLEPKVLIAADGHLYRGKAHNAFEKVQHLMQRIPSIQHTIVVPYLWPENINGIADTPRTILYDSSVRVAGDLHKERFPFNHPLYILFSSGTTGKPKCIVHGVGGTLLNHLKEHRLHTDLKERDTLFYFTTTNWMMWNWLVSGLGTGSKIVLYDGDPLGRDGRMLFDITDKERISVFGTSAKFLSTIEKQGLNPRETHDLASVHTILSTGSTLHGPQFDYVYEHVHPTAQLSSVTGGTDIIGGFVIGSPVLPVRREELQARSLGYKVEVFDEGGNSAPPSVRGELVCTAPFPSQPLGFWNDPEDERYLKTYFTKYGPTVWHHGDYAELTPSGGAVIHGRSDATLNPGGVRIGTAEIYTQVEKIPEVKEAVAIGQKVAQDERIVLFVVLQEGQELTDELTSRIRSQIRAGASPRHVPALILATPALPKTRNGKLAELAVKAIVHGQDVTNTDALMNPESLVYFKERPELR